MSKKYKKTHIDIFVHLDCTENELREISYLAREGAVKALKEKYKDCHVDTGTSLMGTRPVLDISIIKATSQQESWFPVKNTQGMETTGPIREPILYAPWWRYMWVNFKHKLIGK